MENGNENEVKGTRLDRMSRSFNNRVMEAAASGFSDYHMVIDENKKITFRSHYYWHFIK